VGSVADGRWTQGIRSTGPTGPAAGTDPPCSNMRSRFGRRARETTGVGGAGRTARGGPVPAAGPTGPLGARPDQLSGTVWLFPARQATAMTSAGSPSRLRGNQANETSDVGRPGEGFAFRGKVASGTSGADEPTRRSVSAGPREPNAEHDGRHTTPVGFRGNQTPNTTSAVGGTPRQSVSAETKCRTRRALWAAHHASRFPRKPNAEHDERCGRHTTVSASLRKPRRRRRDRTQRDRLGRLC
jgi:hypothetical protein